MKRGDKGRVTGCAPVLEGARAALLRFTATGGLIVRLLEKRGAYAHGDILQIGPGELKPAEHEWEELDRIGRVDDATHACSKCGLLIEMNARGEIIDAGFYPVCSEELGVY